ncbi:MAG: hypothetical protein RL685_3065 [Pseudomonadota bacterium]|jgi:hypothetical protein
MTITFDPAQPVAVQHWSNYSGTIGPIDIPHFFTIPGDPAKLGNALEVHGKALSEILEYCFSAPQPLPLRAIGSGWSFSPVLQPEQVVVDTGAMYVIKGIPHQHWTGSYLARAQGQGFRPVFVEGGAGIGTLNDKLGRSGRLALQTSGAGNGHRMGGCIATGTHGSALRVGALHDTVLAMYLLVAPQRALLIQSDKAPTFHASVADWLQEQTKIPTQLIDDEQLLAAARVGLGSLGFVFGAVVEATGLYRLEIHRVRGPANDPAILHAIRTLDTSQLHAHAPDDRPYHFDVVMNPYPVDGKDNWFVTIMYKRSAANTKFASPRLGIPRTTVDTMGLISSLVDVFGGGLLGGLTREIVGQQICNQLENDAKPLEETLFPGQIFGPTTLPKGQGASTEIVVDHGQALAALDTVHQVLLEQAQAGNLMLGVVAARFVPKTRSLIGMNQHEMNCFIELPSVNNHGVRELFRALWQKLQQSGINFACHWGQLGGFSPARTQQYYREHAEQWTAARRKLLVTDTAMKVFGAKLLQDAGLDGG